MKTSVLYFLKLKHSIKQPVRENDPQSARRKRSQKPLSNGRTSKTNHFFCVSTNTFFEIRSNRIPCRKIFTKRNTRLRLRRFLPVPFWTGGGESQSPESIIITARVRGRSFILVIITCCARRLRRLARVKRKAGVDGCRWFSTWQHSSN